MKISNKTRGSVSVFLVIILVPCLLVSSIFVDVGRVHLSSNIANASADLALNGLLTYYDHDLSEWYGYMASCQDINTHYGEATQNFIRMLKSQNLDDSEVILVSDYAMDAFSDDEISDLLKMEVLSAEDTIIQPVTGANLTNSTIIKTQTVEFMKYRAPITLTMGLIETLRNQGGQDLLDQSKNEPLVESKQAYYEAEGELLGDAYKSYKQIRKYSDSKINNIEINNTNLQKELEKLQKYRDTYKKIHKLYVMNLCNTNGLSVFERPVVDWGDYSYDEEDVCSREEEKKDPTTGATIIDPATGEAEIIYYIDGGDVDDIITEINKQITNFNTAKSEVETKGSAIAYGTDVYDIQYWVQLYKAVNKNTYFDKMKTAGKKLADAYAKAEAMEDCDGDPDDAPDWDALEAAMDNAEALEKYMKANESDGSDVYLTLVNRLETISAANKDNIDPQKVKVDGKTIGTALSDISTELDKTISDLDDCIDILKVAIEGKVALKKSDRVPSLDTLEKDAGNYNTALNGWTNKANTTGTAMADEDKELIAGTAMEEDEHGNLVLSKDNLSESCKKITKESVQALKKRLEGIKKQLEEVKKAVESLKYGNTKFKDIENYNKFKSKANNKVSADSIPLKKSDLENYASQTFQQLFEAYDKIDSPGSYLLTGDVNNVELNPGNDNAEGASYKVPELYLHLHKQYGKIDASKVKSEEDKQDTAKKEAEDKAKNTVKRTAPSTNNITRSFSPEGSKFSIAEGLLSVIDLVKNLMTGNVASIRDNLYAGTYIMEMFSYGTFENEGKRELALKKNPDLKLNLTNYTTEYPKAEVAGDSSKTADENKGTWLSEDPTDTYNKSLTNHLINDKNNYAYQCEVEYILYGETNEKNIESAYSDIYAIRYALNLVSAFQNFWSGSNATATAVNAIAQFVAGITGYIIPPPVTKVVILPILTIFETSRDLDRLEAGFKVELYKSDADDWQLSLEGVTDMSGVIGKLTGQTGGSATGPKEDAEKGLQYSDYITIFVHMGLTNSNTSEAMYLRMAEVIEANMKHITKDNGYTFSKSHVFFTLDAQIRTRPTMITLPIFSSYDNDLDTKTDWCTFNISTKRGY